MIDTLIRRKTELSIFVVWLFTVSGIIGILLGHLDWFIPKTPLNLIIGTILLVINYPISNGRTFLAWAACFVLGILFEVAGVASGVIFGEYYYGDNLGPKVAEVPWLIGANWAVLTFTTSAIARHHLKGFWPTVLAGAGFMFLLDLFIEPLAPVFDFWYWVGGYAPVQNFLAWFAVSLLMHVITFRLTKPGNYTFSLYYFVAQLLFFVILFLAL